MRRIVCAGTPALLLTVASWAGPLSTAALASSPLEITTPRALATGLAVRAVGTGAEPSEDVLLQRRTARRWVTVASTQASPTGRFRFTYVPRRRAARYVLRAATARARSAEAVTQTRLVTFMAVGDVNLGDVPGQNIARFGPRWPWKSVGPVLRKADVALANLECAVSLRGSPVEKTFRFRGLPSSLRAAARSGGLDVVNLANNHAGDFGTTAFTDTLRNARRFGLATSGGGFTLQGALAPAVVTRLGLRIAVVGFSAIGPYSFATTGARPGTAWATPQNVRAAVRAARRQADVVIATFHWGVELATEPSAQQRQLAQLALNAGAAAVIGAHPHVLQPVRLPAAKKLIAYSLGNFVFGAHSPGTEATGILTLGLDSGGVVTNRFRPATIVSGRPILR